MSQGPRDPQRKLRLPQEAPSDALPEAAAESGAEAPQAGAPPAAATVPAPVTPFTPAIPPPPAPAIPPPPAPAIPPPPAPAIPPPPAPAQVGPAPRYAAPPASAAEPVAAVRPALAGVPAEDDGDSSFDDEPDEPLTLKDRLRRLSPTFVTLTVGSFGSMVFLALAMTSHTTPVAVLMSAAVVTSLVFALDTAICTAASYRAGERQESGRALLFALVGGISALVCASATAGTLILILVLTS